MVLIALIFSILLAAIFVATKRHRKRIFVRKNRKVHVSPHQIDITDQQQWLANSIAPNTSSEEMQVSMLQETVNRDDLQSIADSNSETDEGQKQIPSILNQENEEAVRGDDFQVDLKLDEREALFGAEKEIRVSCLRICQNCAGTGYLQPNSMILNIYPECPICDGRGNKTESRKLRITVPAGVSSGTRLRVMGEGDVGQYGGESGDLYIYLSVLDSAAKPLRVLDTKPLLLDTGTNFSEQTQPTLEQESSTPAQPLDLIADLRLDLREAQLGADVEIKIKHLELCSACQGQGCSYCGAQGTKQESKRLRITVPSGVQGGTNLRVRGEGNNGGDLYLHILLDVDETT